jgi:predicted ATPase
MQQDRKADSRQVLAPVYDRFTEGFETADLSAARAMLESLPPG